jgi:hypothetical protein
MVTSNMHWSEQEMEEEQKVSRPSSSSMVTKPSSLIYVRERKVLEQERRRTIQWCRR